MKIDSAIKWANLKLKSKNIGNHSLDASILLAYALGVEREYLLAHPEQILGERQQELFEAAIENRINGWPIAYIIGSKEFWSICFNLNQETLIPRPDSEILVEAVLNEYSKDSKGSKIKILDLGTGSGCLILSILSELTSAEGTAIDISPSALECAKGNAINLGLKNRCKFVLSDWLGKVEGKFDIVISNPPYIPAGEIDGLQNEIRLYEPVTALNGGEDGLDCYRKIAKTVHATLKENAVIFLEIGAGQEEMVAQIFASEGYVLVNSYKDLSGIVRCIQFKNK